MDYFPNLPPEHYVCSRGRRYRRYPRSIVACILDAVSTLIRFVCIATLLGTLATLTFLAIAGLISG